MKTTQIKTANPHKQLKRWEKLFCESLEYIGFYKESHTSPTLGEGIGGMGHKSIIWFCLGLDRQGSFSLTPIISGDFQS